MSLRSLALPCLVALLAACSASSSGTTDGDATIVDQDATGGDTAGADTTGEDTNTTPRDTGRDSGGTDTRRDTTSTDAAPQDTSDVVDGACRSSTDCPLGERCRNGECVDIPTTCTVGERFCDGETLFICQPDGRTFNEVDCFGVGGYCEFNAERPSCIQRACEPGFRACDGNVAQRCDSRGAALVTEDCGDDACANGDCVRVGCDPGQVVCVGNAVYQCNDDGSNLELYDTCRTTEICANGGCEPVGCGSAGCPAPNDRCDGNTLVTFNGDGTCIDSECNFDDVELRRDCARDGRLCDPVSVTCVTSGCTNPPTCQGTTPILDLAGCTCRPCAAGECPVGATCRSDGSCARPTDNRCTSDTQCRNRARELGFDAPDTAACDPAVGCYIPGTCDNPEAGGGLGLPPIETDPFDAQCAQGTTCRNSIDFLGSTFRQSCEDCVVSTNAGCRSGEVCTDSGGGLPIPGLGGPYCKRR